MNSKPTIVIVCGYSSGATLANMFNKNGYQCIHVTLARLVKNASFIHDETQYIKNIVIYHENNLTDCIHQIAEYSPIGIVAASESGVLLADKLAINFNVPKNQFGSTLARRNKYYMIESLRAQNLPAQKQIKTNSLEQLLEWYQKNQFNRIVLKPLMSVTSDNVYYCNSIYEIKNAFLAIINSKTAFNEINEEVLAQEYIAGDEYIVNTFSFEGKHKVIDIWLGYTKTPDLVSNDLHADLLSQADPIHKKLTDYIYQVLPALGIENGAAHSEVRITPQGEPYLIETGARLAGKISPIDIEKIYGESQFSLLLKMFSEPETVRRFISTPLIPNYKARYVYFKADVEGIIKKELDMTPFQQIPSLSYIELALEKGKFLHKTCKTNKIPRPGFAYLLHQDMSQIEHDYNQLTELEKSTYIDLLE